MLKRALRVQLYATEIFTAAILTLKSNGVDKVSEADLLALLNMTFDGINENGVVMNSNVVPALDLFFSQPITANPAFILLQ